MAFEEGIRSTIDIHDLIRTLDAVGPRLAGRAEDVHFVKTLFASREFETLFKLHQEVTTGPTKRSRPSTMNALELTHTLSFELAAVPSQSAQELITCLGRPHINSLIAAHDKVANKQFPQHFLNDPSSDSTVVRLNKEGEPLGATIKAVGGAIAIARVLHGSVAHKSGLLNAGDVLLSINGQPVGSKSVDEVADELQELKGVVTFQVQHKSSLQYHSQASSKFSMRVRPRFSYNPCTDPSLPCSEAGLGFCKGDVLHILDQDDAEWWQAAKEGHSLKIGLVPSLLRQLRHEHGQASKSRASKRSGTLTNLKRKIKSQKTVYDAFRIHGYGFEDVHPYEEVVKIAPQNNRPRPLLLVATHPTVQIQAIMDQLMATDSSHFSLPRRPPHSVSRSEVASVEDVMSVMSTGKTCLLSVPVQAIPPYRTSELKPFVVFFSPIPAEGSLLYTGSEGRRLAKDNALAKERHQHLFDQVLNYSDVQSGVREVGRTARRLRRDFQWVPSAWVHGT